MTLITIKQGLLMVYSDDPNVCVSDFDNPNRPAPEIPGRFKELINPQTKTVYGLILKRHLDDQAMLDTLQESIPPPLKHINASKPQKLTLNWAKYQGETWYKLADIDIASRLFKNLTGVCIIWHGGPIATTLRIGTGNISHRIYRFNQDPEIRIQDCNLGVRVTWAPVASEHQAGVERYLVGKLSPKVYFGMTTETPIEVNLPW